MVNFVYLASQSPRRRQLLEQLGVRYKLLLPEAGEDAEALELVLKNEAPSAYVKRVTGLKLDAAAARLNRLGRNIYGKPDDAQDAQRMLTELAGKTHRVLTAVAIQQGAQRFEATSTSRVSLEPMTAAQITAYVATGEPMGKAGAYAIQGKVAMHITRINGSYTGIMGLPLWETAQLMHAAGFQI
jgi:septum formation protein